MILQGENDRFVPRADAEAYAAEFAAARLETISDCGHSVVAERLDEKVAKLQSR